MAAQLATVSLPTLLGLAVFLPILLGFLVTTPTLLQLAISLALALDGEVVLVPEGGSDTNSTTHRALVLDKEVAPALMLEEATDTMLTTVPPLVLDKVVSLVLVLEEAVEIGLAATLALAPDGVVEEDEVSMVMSQQERGLNYFVTSLC